MATAGSMLNYLGTPPPVAKAKPLKAVGAADPAHALDFYNPPADPAALNQWLYGLSLQGADYSQIPAPRSADILNQIASERADATYNPIFQQYNALQDRQSKNREISSQAATAWGVAMADILQGGKTGAEGMAYAKENYGGSYLGLLAADMSKDLLREITADFDENDMKLADAIADAASKRAELYDKLYNDLVDEENANIKAGIQFADSSFETRMKAAGLFVAGEIKKSGGDDAPEVKKFSDGTSRQWNPKTRKWDVVTRTEDKAGSQIVYANGVPYFVDPVTRKTEPVVPGTGTAAGAKAAAKKAKTAAASGDGKSERIYGNSETGYYYIRNGKKVPIAGTGAAAAGKDGTGAAGGASASQQSTTVARAQKAAHSLLDSWMDAIRQKYALPENASDAQKAKNTQKYQAELSRNFGRAMFKVITEIAPHLKAIGYSAERIKWEAYQIVRQSGMVPLPSYKAPKPPKDKAAQVAANGLPKTVGGNIPVVNEAGKAVPKNVQTVLQLAHKYLGVKYVWGGETPAGFDCSGFVRYLYKQVGIDPGGYTMAQWRNPNAIQIKSQADLQPGDAVFFNWGTHPETGEQGPLHEGLYIGDGLFIQAPRTGDVVKISKMSERSDFLGARRFVKVGSA